MKRLFAMVALLAFVVPADTLTAQLPAFVQFQTGRALSVAQISNGWRYLVQDTTSQTLFLTVYDVVGGVLSA